MSKEADQAITMLCVIKGVAIMFVIERPFAKVELQQATTDIYNDCIAAIEGWPIRKNKEWIEDRYAQFKEAVLRPDMDDDGFYLEIVLVAERLAIDLQDMYTVGVRRKLVAPLLSHIQKFIQHMDPEGLNFKAAENAGRNMDLLYEYLEIEDKQIG